MNALEFYNKLLEIKPFFERIEHIDKINSETTSGRKKVYVTHRETKLVHKGGGHWVEYNIDEINEIEEKSGGSIDKDLNKKNSLIILDFEIDKY